MAAKRTNDFISIVWTMYTGKFGFGKLNLLRTFDLKNAIAIYDCSFEKSLTKDSIYQIILNSITYGLIRKKHRRTKF